MLVLIDVGDASPIELPPGRRSHAKAAGLVNGNESEYVISGITCDSTVIESCAPEGGRQNNDLPSTERSIQDFLLDMTAST